MRYRILQRANPLDRDKKKFYASPVYSEEMGIKELAEDISDASTLNRIDVEACLIAFVRRLPLYLKKGIRVKLGSFGRIKLGFSSDGVEEKKQLTPRAINKVKVIFMQSSELKDELSSTIFELVKDKEETTEEIIES